MAGGLRGLGLKAYIVRGPIIARLLCLSVGFTRCYMWVTDVYLYMYKNIIRVRSMRVCVCMYVCTYIYICFIGFTLIYIYIYTCVCVCVHTCL